MIETAARSHFLLPVHCKHNYCYLLINAQSTYKSPNHDMVHVYYMMIVSEQAINHEQSNIWHNKQTWVGRLVPQHVLVHWMRSCTKILQRNTGIRKWSYMFKFPPTHIWVEYYLPSQKAYWIPVVMWKE